MLLVGRIRFTDDYNLYVTKGIRAERIKVDVAGDHGWADYVFKSDYNLQTPESLDLFIKKHGHLPNIPTTEEVIQNGIDLAEMQTKLLEKIEELTLYVIKLDKMNNILNDEIIKLKYLVNK